MNGAGYFLKNGKVSMCALSVLQKKVFMISL